MSSHLGLAGNLSLMITVFFNQVGFINGLLGLQDNVESADSIYRSRAGRILRVTKKSFKPKVVFLRWDHSEVPYASESFCY